MDFAARLARGRTLGPLLVGEAWQAMTTRCTICRDVAPNEWRHCLKCHAWADLHAGLHPDGEGLDEFRLRRALRHLHRNDRRESVRALLAKLVRRVAELEETL